MKDIWIKVFKSGKHKNSSVPDKEFTIEDVKKIAKTYNDQDKNSRHDAPLILDDHNKFVDKNGNEVKKPAVGWVQELKENAGELFAKILPTPTLKEAVKNNYYKKVSIGLRENNLLDHIAVLGCVNPAVKGLGMLDFDETEIAGYEFSETEKEEIQKLDEKYPDLTIDFAPKPDDTMKAALKEQQKRSQKFGIGIKDSAQIFQKPAPYSKLADDNFGDPVHYRFPIQDRANTIVSMQAFDMYDNRRSYTETERQIVGARIVAAIEKHKITKEDMAKFRLYDESENKNDNKFTTTFEVTMDPTIKEARDKFITALQEETSAEVATKAAKLFDSFFSGIKTGAEKNDNADKKFSDNPEFAALVKKNEEMEKKLRTKEFEEFLSGRKNSITPAMKPAAMALMEMGHRHEGEIAFTEGEQEKKLNGVDVVKRFIEKIPDQVSQEEIANGQNYNGNTSQQFAGDGMSEEDQKEEEKFFDEVNKKYN